LHQTIDSVVESTRDALTCAGLPESDRRRLYACMGLAGVNVPAVHEQFCGWQHPYAWMMACSDLRVACAGAHAGSDGAALVAGTGTCGFVHVGDVEQMIGGHGFPAGDKGSGAWIGLEAVKYTLLALDQLEPSCVLSQSVMKSLNAEDAISIVERLNHHRSRDYAKLAPLVFECAQKQDSAALAIIRDGAHYLSLVAKQLLGFNPPRFSMLGGLADLYRPWLAADVSAQLSPVLESPEMGAARLAVLNWQHTQQRKHA
jgi:glucosamine kinase